MTASSVSAQRLVVEECLKNVNSSEKFAST